MVAIAAKIRNWDSVKPLTVVKNRVSMATQKRKSTQKPPYKGYRATERLHFYPSLLIPQILNFCQSVPNQQVATLVAHITA